MPPKRKSDDLDPKNVLDADKKRKSRPPLATAIDGLPAYWEDPTHTAHPKAVAGALKMEVVLGPNACNPRANDAASNLPKAIAAARTKYPKCKFKAGHVLNCDLGGDGKNAKNLTILSSSGNTSMTLPDNALKRAANALKKVYEAIYGSDVAIDGEELKTIKYGIELKITVSTATWGDEEPDCYICNELKYSVHEWGDVPVKYQSNEVLKAMDNVRKNIRSAHGSKVVNSSAAAEESSSDDES
jgi:hypothetical protein